MNTYIISQKKETCYGCRACENICPQKAIQMQFDDEGFLYPALDTELCIKCGLCNKVCPYEKEDFHKEEPEVYAVKCKSKETLSKSSSGGAFSVFADYVINNGGYVGGCIFDENLKAIHTISNEPDDIDCMRGSKYVQSDVNDTFIRAKSILDDGKLLIYTGTPCQIGGLRSFLSRDYENLITVDLICHGVPSQKLLEFSKKYYEKKYNGRLFAINFRDKKNNGWSARGTIKINKAGKVLTKKISPFTDYYYYYYLDNSVNRMSCYSCKYATEKRCSDITIGDFWNIEDAIPGFCSDGGASVVILNTQKGKDLFNKLANDVVFEKSNIKIAVSGNGNLNRPTSMPLYRSESYKKINALGFEEAAKQHCRMNYVVPMIKGIIPKKFKRFVKKFIGR